MSGTNGKAANPRLHHPDGTHRDSARSANGSEVDYYDSHIRQHLAEHEAETAAKDSAATPPLGEVEFHGIKWRFLEVEPNDNGAYGFEVRHHLREERHGYVTQEEDGTWGAMGLREEDGFVAGFASWQYAGRFLMTHRRPQKINVEP